MEQNYQLKPAGDRAVLVEFPQTISPELHRAVCAAQKAVEQLPEVLETVQSYCALLVYYDPLCCGYDQICARLKPLLDALDDSSEQQIRTVYELPVCYGGDLGPDLPTICSHSGLSPETVIRLHTAVTYPIYMMGFLPGFTYLGGLDERLATPRLTTPRTKIEAGSVGIAGKQTGVYPLDSPGGWQILGRTPLRLFDPRLDDPVILRPGGFVRFRAIDRQEFDRLQALAGAGNCPCKRWEESL